MFEERAEIVEGSAETFEERAEIVEGSAETFEERAEMFERCAETFEGVGEIVEGREKKVFSIEIRVSADGGKRGSRVCGQYLRAFYETGLAFVESRNAFRPSP